MAVHIKQYFATTHEKQLISDTASLYISFQAFRQKFLSFCTDKIVNRRMGPTFWPWAL